jgi:hypothetical protein
MIIRAGSSQPAPSKSTTVTPPSARKSQLCGPKSYVLSRLARRGSGRATSSAVSPSIAAATSRPTAARRSRANGRSRTSA